MPRPTSTPHTDMLYNLPAAPLPMNGRPHGHLAGKKMGFYGSESGISELEKVVFLVEIYIFFYLK